MAAEPEQVMREQYIRIMADKTNLPRPVLREQVNLLRQVEQTIAIEGPDFPHLTDEGRPRSTLGNAGAVARYYGFSFRFNLMSRKIETIRELAHVPADVRELSHLTDFEDLGMQHGLDDQRIQKHRDRMAFNNAYHPFVDYLVKEKQERGPWDPSQGDWIAELAASLDVEHDVRPIRNMLLMRWLISAVAAAHLRDETDYGEGEAAPKAPRGVLVLQGPQNMGKTAWFGSITPPGMYKEGLQMNLNDMNHMKTATNRLIVEIGEADHATSGRMANYMKTIIGRSVDEVRLAFQKEEVRMVRRNVFCATVNPATFLDDDQNTRWWTVTLKDIDFDQLARVDIKRLWQQVYELWLSGEDYHLSQGEMDTLNSSNEKFRAIPFFEQWLIDTFDFDSDKDTWDVMQTTTQLIVGCGNLQMDIDKNKIRSIILRLTGIHNIRAYVEGVQGRYWRLPKRRR
ncbi:MAG: hypothetical protein JRJ85_19850 [Deltaproteobacteria bacterium]|nr:hypothetical protein [Deltaproteobacteria bacterium]